MKERDERYGRQTSRDMGRRYIGNMIKEARKERARL